MLSLVDYKQFILYYWFSTKFLFSSQHTSTLIQSISFYFYIFFFYWNTVLQRRQDNNVNSCTQLDIELSSSDLNLHQCLSNYLESRNDQVTTNLHHIHKSLVLRELMVYSEWNYCSMSWPIVKCFTTRRKVN